MAIQVVMPEMGEGVVEGTVSRWLKQVGEQVDQYEPILEIETDKVTTEATAEEAGTLLEILIPEGETVDVGTVLATIGQPGESVPQNGKAPAKEAAPEPAPMPEPAAAPTTTAARTSPKRYTGRISPVVGRIAAEHDVDLSLVSGTGRDGRITKKDILAHIDQRQAQPEPTYPTQTETPKPVTPSPRHPVTPSPAAGEIVPLTNMRRAIAEHMVRSVQTSPHVTTVFEFDFTAVAKHRAAHKAQFARDGANLTFTAYIIAATVEALKQHPMVNSSWTDSGIALKREINVGMATAIDDGLIVPVIKGADGMNLLGLSRTINDLAQRARNNQLQPGDVQGGTFSLTNHGTSGSLFATPIINQPQCGILGVGKIEKRVKVINDAIAIRPLAYVSFTFDHRILDGKTADDFVSSIKQVIENWQ
ncbi:MAG: dihydrolipoamide acetyltransferase component of pyruvate dehydrogenase complex [Ardenticatenaceae bacterium]|nr:MAG: dihydrolipoamide acetyltransferase component of pyruvate dehydrogenase complex [Ardenticatenaceae bacterium]